MHVFRTPFVCRITRCGCAEAVLYVEVKHWKSTLIWPFAPIETLFDMSCPPDDPAPRASQLFLHLWSKPLDLSAHQQRTQLRALHPHDHDLFLSLASAWPALDSDLVSSKRTADGLSTAARS